jgi:hypothetical protein
MREEKCRQKFAQAAEPQTGVNWAADSRQSSTANVGGFFLREGNHDKARGGRSCGEWRCGACIMVATIALALMLVRSTLATETGRPAAIHVKVVDAHEI